MIDDSDKSDLMAAALKRMDEAFKEPMRKHMAKETRVLHNAAEEWLEELRLIGCNHD